MISVLTENNHFLGIPDNSLNTTLMFCPPCCSLDKPYLLLQGQSSLGSSERLVLTAGPARICPGTNSHRAQPLTQLSLLVAVATLSQLGTAPAAPRGFCGHRADCDLAALW